MKFLSLFLSISLLLSSSGAALAATEEKTAIAMARLQEVLSDQTSALGQIPYFILTSGGYYEAYMDVLTKKRLAPEVHLPAPQVRALLEAESKKLVKTLKRNAWRPGGERFKQAVDLGVQVLVTMVLMMAAGDASRTVANRYTQWNVRASYGRLGGLSALSTKGGHWLSRFLLGGAWNGYGRVWLQHFVLDLTIFTAVITPLTDAYERLVPRLVNLRYLSDMKLAFHQSEAILLAWAQMNTPLEEEAVWLDYDGTEVEEAELNRLQWHNKEAQEEHLVLLYALRYLNHYLQTSQDKYRDELVLLELLNLSLPWGSDYETANGLTIPGNPGRLFYPQEREDVLKTLQEVEEMEEILQENNIVGKCQYEMQNNGKFFYGDLNNCIKTKYQIQRYGGILA